MYFSFLVVIYKQTSYKAMLVRFMALGHYSFFGIH